MNSAFFNAVAAAYDRPFHERFYRFVAAALAARLPGELEVETMLEVGAGAGFATRVFQDRFPEVRIAALEPAAKMLARGKSRLPGVDWLCRPLAAMPSASFDLVLSSMSYHWLDRRERQKIKALASGGVLALALPLSGGAEKSGNLALKRILFRLRSGNWPGPARRPRKVAANIRRQFQDVDFSELIIDEEYESCHDLSRSLVERGAMRSLFGEQAAMAASQLAAVAGRADFRWTIGLFVAW